MKHIVSKYSCIHIQDYTLSFFCLFSCQSVNARQKMATAYGSDTIKSPMLKLLNSYKAAITEVLYCWKFTNHNGCSKKELKLGLAGCWTNQLPEVTDSNPGWSFSRRNT